MNNLLSYSSVKLDLFSRDGLQLKPASGFVLEVGTQYYLITNRHVLSGASQPAHEQQGPGPEPYLLKTSIHSHSGEAEKHFALSTGTRQRITIPLYDDSNTPRWIEHRAKPMTDIAALPIQANENWRLIQTLQAFSGNMPGGILNSKYWSRVSAIPLSAIDTGVEYGPSDAVHIIGYPLGWAPAGSSKSSSAFWRTGWIASEINEPGVEYAHAFYVDPCAPEGMTGSPVVGMKKDQVKLLGVYSDRSTAELGGNAGLVWDAWLVKELIGAS